MHMLCMCMPRWVRGQDKRSGQHCAAPPPSARTHRGGGYGLGDFAYGHFERTTQRYERESDSMGGEDEGTSNFHGHATSLHGSKTCVGNATQVWLERCIVDPFRSLHA